MAHQITIGFPRMHYEFSEKRDFLPGLVARLGQGGAQVMLEHSYGSAMGFREIEYLEAFPGVQFVSHEETLDQDYVLVLRCPPDDELRKLRRGACLISMLHYATRPQRVELLRALGVEGISLDEIKDDVGRRLVESLRSVAWNGVEAGFRVLLRTYPSPGLQGRDRGPIYATVLGVGAVGMHAVQAASRYGDAGLWQQISQDGVPGVHVSAFEFDLTTNEAVMKDVLARTDILVDATQRRDPSRPVVPNPWIAWMPKHAVLVDLSVDPYVCTDSKLQVKGIEGIPHGNLDQYVFTPDDPAFDRVPECVSTANRRHSVSCYSWPGIHPRECMTRYGRQLRPLLRTLVERGGFQNINPKGKFFERALSRAMLSRQGGD